MHIRKPVVDIAQQPVARRIHGNRFAKALVSWVFAGVGVLSSLIFAGAGIVSGSANGILAVTPLLAWASLGVMTIGWLKDRRCHWVWPIIGRFAGVSSAVIFALAFFFYISAVPIAIYLVFWHLRGNMRGTDVA